MLIELVSVAALVIFIGICVAYPVASNALFESLVNAFTIFQIDDTTKPQVAIVNPPGGTTISASGSLVVSGTSSDDIGITKVEISTNLNAFRAASQVNANWNYWSFTGTIPIQGVNKVTAKATDTSGNTAVYEISVYQYGSPSPTGMPPTGTPDTTPPNTTFLTAYDGTGKSVPNAGSTSSTTITISFSGTDNVAVQRYEGALDGALYAPVNSPASLTFVSNGQHTYRVRAIDAAGNTDQTPITFTWTVMAASPPPPPPPPPGTTTWIQWSPSAYIVRVSLSGSTITAIDSNNIPIATSSDAATVIQAAVNAVKAKPTGGTVHINPGVYLMKKTISLSGVNNFILEGNTKETTILRWDAGYLNMFTKSGSALSTNFTIRSIDIDGANKSKKLLDFTNIKNLLIDNIILERHNAGGSYIDEDGPGVYIEDLDGGLVQKSIIRNPNGIGDAFAIGGFRLTFQNNEIIRQGTPGGGFTSGGLVDSKILNNNFHDFKGYSATSLENFQIRSAPHSFKNIEIAYNTYTNLDGQAISSVGGQGRTGTYDNINIHHNKITNANGGIRLNALDNTSTNTLTYNSRITDNTLSYTGGISAGPIKTSQISNNIIDHTSPGGWRGYGIYLHPVSDNITMNGNTISSTAKAAYYCPGSTYNILVNGVSNRC